MVLIYLKIVIDVLKKAVCGSNGTDCNWSPSFQECLNKCTQPKTTTIPCENRTACDCLKTNTDTTTTNPMCVWCQYSQTFTSTDTTTITVPKGRCLFNNNLYPNKCTGDIASGGYAGKLITVRPTNDCASTTISPNVNDPASGVSDPKIAAIVRDVSSGAVTEVDIQKRIPPTANVFVTDMSPSFTDGEKGKIQFTIQNLGSHTTDELNGITKQAVSQTFNVDPSQVNVALYAATSSKKRQTGSNVYLADTTVQSAPPPNQPGNGTQPTTVEPPPQSEAQPTTVAPPPDNLKGSGFMISPVCYLILLLAYYLPFWAF